MNLFLIGYRCTGKSTIGKSVAAALGWSFVDSDIQVIKQSGMSINDIVATEGWQAFRRMERSIIKQICTDDRRVVATGGGVVLDPDNIKVMATSGIIVWLCATAKTIHRRMFQDKNSPTLRPALTGKGQTEEIQDMLLQRNPYYESASDFCIHTDELPVNEISKRIIEKIKDRIGE